MGVMCCLHRQTAGLRFGLEESFENRGQVRAVQRCLENDGGRSCCCTLLLSCLDYVLELKLDKLFSTGGAAALLMVPPHLLLES